MATAFDIALLNATKEVMVAMIGKGHAIPIWIEKGEMKGDKFSDDANAIADALRDAVTKTR
jgi:hypothetical protein